MTSASSKRTSSTAEQNAEGNPLGAVPPVNEKEGQKQQQQQQQTPPNAPTVPDGGIVAWTQVVGSWVLFFNTFGLINTFGIYQTYYASGDLFNASSSDISWIGSIQGLTILFVGALTGPLYDAGYLRSLLLVGTFGVVFGHMMLSLCHEYYQVFLAQGITVGLGASCLFIPGIAVLPGYFAKHIGLAVGLAVSGSSFGKFGKSQLLHPVLILSRRNCIPHRIL